MTATSRFPWPARAIVLLMILQVAGCMTVGSGDFAMPLFCTAADPPFEWFATLQAVMLVAFIPIGLVLLPSPRLRPIAIAFGIAALLGLAAQYALLENGTLWCDVP